MKTPQKIMQNALLFFEELSFPKDSARSLANDLDAILASASCGAFSELLERYDKTEKCDYTQMLADMKKISADAGIHEYSGDLLLFVSLAPKLKERYAERGYDPAIFYDSMNDLRYKLFECLEVHGLSGSFVARWFPGFFDLTRFAFDRLQFEIRPLGKDVEYKGHSLSADTPVLNTHIPRTGKRLDRSALLSSYDRGAKFFKANFSETFADTPIIFFCSSWLLDPWNLTVLSDGSNLRAFIEDFYVFESGEYDSYKDLWRLFDKEYNGNADDLPTNSSFRRAYVDRIKRGEKTGWGKGIFVYDIDKK